MKHVRSSGRIVAAIALSLVLGLAQAQAAGAGFVTANGHRFELGGQPYYFAGANLWTGMNLGAAGPSGNRARLLRELDRLAMAGVTNLRVMAGTEGPDAEPYRMVPALQTGPGSYNEDVFQGLDYLLDEIARRGMRAVLCLNNYWHWSGGMAQYVSWAEGTPIPYPNDTGDWWQFQLYSARFYANATCQQLYRAHIQAVIFRQNTVNGRLYRDDPTIFSWELANEPRLYPDSWIDDTAAYIRSLDGNHMVTVGSEGDWGGNFFATHDGPNIAYATCHIWPQNAGFYDPEDPSTSAGSPGRR